MTLTIEGRGARLYESNPVIWKTRTRTRGHEKRGRGKRRHEKRGHGKREHGIHGHEKRRLAYKKFLHGRRFTM